MVVDPDLALVVGLGIALLSTLSFAAAWVDRRRPWLGTAIGALGLGLVALALATKPEGYGLRDLPLVLYGVLGRYLL